MKQYALFLAFVFSGILTAPFCVNALDFTISAPSGGDCATATTTANAAVAAWNEASKTCTLSTNINPEVMGKYYDSIVFSSDELTLDGVGHTLTSLNISVSDHSSTTIKNLRLDRGQVSVIRAPGTRVENVSVTGATEGFRVDGSADVTIVDSEVSGSSRGLYAVGSSPRLTLSRNSFHGNQTNIFFYPFMFYEGSVGHLIDTTNTVDGKSVYYFEEARDSTFDSLPDVGMFLCVKCSNVTLSNTLFDNLHNRDHITLYGSASTTLRGNTIKNAKENAVSVMNSTGTTFADNYMYGNGTGVYLTDSPGGIFDGNTFFANGSGIDFNQGSSGGTVTGNTFFYTPFAISMQPGSAARVVQNNFYGTYYGGSIQSIGGNMTASETLPTGGNYWASYGDCVDVDNNGVCDTPYVEYHPYGTVTDEFPWKNPDGWKVYVPPVSCSNNCFSNVLFLPGLEASRLYVVEGESENQLWEPNRNLDVEKLYMNPDGTSRTDGVYTSDIIGETNTPIPTGLLGQNIYKSFEENMDSLVNDGSIAEWRAFPYDWRRSVSDIVTAPVRTVDGEATLIETLSDLAASSKSGKVTIIAHSNGGLVAKALLLKLREMKDAGESQILDKVDLLVLVAVPQIGTASAVPAVLHGYDQQIAGGWLLDNLHARELGRNMPGAYGLLPSREYINRVSASPVSFADNAIPSGVTTDFVSAYGNVVDSYSEYKSFLFGGEGRTNPATDEIAKPIVLSPELFGEAESLHGAIDTWVPPEGLRVVEVSGWGLDTVAGFEYYPKLTGCGSSGAGAGCANAYILDERPIFTSDGDKTVVEPSALYGEGEKVWVNLPEHNAQLSKFRRNRQHKDILEIEELEEFLSSLILDETPVYNNVLSNTKPTDISSRLRISIHSPVTLEAYDSQGNFTGKVCPPDSDFCYVREDIPNSSYLEFGEGKYLNLPEEDMQKTVLRGTDTGTFTYQSEKVSSDGSLVLSQFINIPVTPETVAEVTADPETGAQKMTLDTDGDGVTDVTIEPSDTFDPISYLQVMRAFVQNLDIIKGRKNAFTTRIDSTIKAIQKGKINKVKLKTERFVSVLQKKIEKEEPKKPKPGRLTKAEAEGLLSMLETLLNNLN